MLSHVSILCFAASYLIVLALEISRLVFRSGVRGAFMLGWAAAGLLAHSIYLYYKADGSSGVPLSSWRDWFVVAAWFLMVVYLYLVFYHPRNSLGIFSTAAGAGADRHGGRRQPGAVRPAAGLANLGAAFTARRSAWRWRRCSWGSPRA